MSSAYGTGPYQIKAYHHLLKPQTCSQHDRVGIDRGWTDSPPPSQPIPSAVWSAQLPFFKGEF